MAELRHGDHIISYDVHGDGPPLVMLRGLGRCVQHWFGYEREMARHFKVITVDLRGIGKTTLPLRFTDVMTDLAGDIVAVLDHLAIDRAHILGVSLGGMVTLATGLAHPERCRSLITVNTSIAGQRALRMTLGGAWAICSGLLRGRLHENLVDVLTSPSFPHDKRPAVAQKLKAIAATDGLYAATVCKQLVVAARFLVKEDLAKLDLPVLLVYGTDDQFVPNINTRKLHAILPNSRLVAIPGAGHEIMIDQPDLLREAVCAWIDEREEADDVGKSRPAPGRSLPTSATS